MSDDTTVARRQVEITNSLGLHMRPANKFVELALQFQSEIRVHYNGNDYNGKSILELTSLAAECGSRLDLEARGADAPPRSKPWPIWSKPSFTRKKRRNIERVALTKEVKFFSICTNDSIPDTLVVDRTYETVAGSDSHCPAALRFSPSGRAAASHRQESVPAVRHDGWRAFIHDAPFWSWSWEN